MRKAGRVNQTHCMLDQFRLPDCFSIDSLAGESIVRSRAWVCELYDIDGAFRTHALFCYNTRFVHERDSPLCKKMIKSFQVGDSNTRVRVLKRERMREKKKQLKSQLGLCLRSVLGLMCLTR